ncbi:MAG: lysophospholipid acyltransferase family protein [Deltaproteobacteria bacterium]|nr:lysophospholipid acyltransferase family protein [Deltaproteobacteria bacterium]
MKKTLVTRMVLIFFGLFPLTLRRLLFRGCMVLLYHLSQKHRIITLQNLKCAFPEKSLSEITRIAKGVFLNLGNTSAEFFEIPLLTAENMNNWVEFEGLEHYRGALAKGKGILFYTAHFGNWELGAACFGLQGIRVHIIYRALDNPVFENFVAWFRSYTGHKVIPKGGASRKIVELLKKNEMVGVLIDQNVSWHEGVFVEFFGRPACTTKRFASLALQTGAAVVPVFIIRQQNGKYKIVIKEEVDIKKTGNDEANLFHNTQKFTSIIEDIVREYPDQYFWLHQRWKTKTTQVER